MDKHSTAINSSLNLSILPTKALQEQLNSYIPKVPGEHTRLL